MQKIKVLGGYWISVFTERFIMALLQDSTGEEESWLPIGSMGNFSLEPLAAYPKKNSGRKEG